MQLTKDRKEPIWAIGLMSGTSLDGVDAALLRTDGVEIAEFGACAAQEYDAPFRQKLKDLLAGSGNEQEIERQLTMLHASVVHTLLRKAKMQPEDVALIGFHGQTIWHKPEEGRTHQIGDGALLARETGIAVVNDFRSNDMAHGGQGAPLVPVFHQALMRAEAKPVAVLNIGGVANVTWIGEGKQELISFDTGPGNALINDWVSQHTGQPYDDGGKLAAQGVVDECAVSQWLQHEYFNLPPPKSLDRNRFSHVILDLLRDPDPAIGRDDRVASVMTNITATLTEFTARSIAAAAQHFPAPPKAWYVAGGGTHNAHLMHRLSRLFRVEVKPITELAYNADMLEAQAFAYLAVRSAKSLPLTFPSTTGVKEAVSGGFHEFPNSR